MPEQISAFELLKGRQRKFVTYYVGVSNCCAADAARRAGYAKDSATVAGCRLLKDPEVKAAIDERLDELAMPAAEVLARLSMQGRGTIADFIDIDVEEEVPGESDRDGNPRKQTVPWRLNLAKARELGLLGLVAEISYDRQGNPKLKLHDSQGALDKLARVRGLYKDSLTVAMEDPLEGTTDEVLLDEIRSRLGPGRL